MYEMSFKACLWRIRIRVHSKKFLTTFVRCVNNVIFMEILLMKLVAIWMILSTGFVLIGKQLSKSFYKLSKIIISPTIHKKMIVNLNLKLTVTPDIYIAYLPLAHVLELLSECTMMMFGVPVGYSSPNTMTDVSTMVSA